MPEIFESVTVRSSRDDTSVVEQHMMLSGKRFVVMARHTKTAPDTHDIQIVGGDIRGTHITERYDAIPQGTRVTVIADVRLRRMLALPGVFGKNRMQKGLEDIIDGLARTA